MQKKSVRRSLSITPNMRDRLAQLVSKQSRDVTEADLIREAIRQYLDEQEDLIRSRRHFQKSLRERVDSLEAALSFHLNVLVYLLANDHETVREAIIAARQEEEPEVKPDIRVLGFGFDEALYLATLFDIMIGINASFC